jgi:hypothetical protein
LKHALIFPSVWSMIHCAASRSNQIARPTVSSPKVAGSRSGRSGMVPPVLRYAPGNVPPPETPYIRLLARRATWWWWLRAYSTGPLLGPTAKVSTRKLEENAPMSAETRGEVAGSAR